MGRYKFTGKGLKVKGALPSEAFTQATGIDPRTGESELASLRRQLDIAEKALKDCRDAINKLPPDAFGTAGSSEGTNWYIRDELIGRADAALKEIEK
jgi:hypothetical protein